MHLKMKCDKEIMLFLSWCIECTEKISDKLKMMAFKMDQVKALPTVAKKLHAHTHKYLHSCLFFFFFLGNKLYLLATLLMCMFQG